MLPAPAKTKGKKVLKEKPQVTKEQAAAITAAATKRKQEQRAREKAEKDELLRAKKELEDQLDALLQRLLHPVVHRHDILPSHVREAVVRNRQLAREGCELRRRMEELHDVIALLTECTFSFKPHEPKPSMMETTLLGREECWNYGDMWLSLHTALSAHPFKGRVEDNVVSWPHVGDDMNGTSLEALQLHSQCTVMSDYEAVANVESLRPFKSPDEH